MEFETYLAIFCPHLWPNHRIICFMNTFCVIQKKKNNKGTKPEIETNEKKLQRCAWQSKRSESFLQTANVFLAKTTESCTTTMQAAINCCIISQNNTITSGASGVIDLWSWNLLPLSLSLSLCLSFFLSFSPLSLSLSLCVCVCAHAWTWHLWTIQWRTPSYPDKRNLCQRKGTNRSESSSVLFWSPLTEGLNLQLQFLWYIKRIQPTSLELYWSCLQTDVLLREQGKCFSALLSLRAWCSSILQVCFPSCSSVFWGKGIYGKSN